MEKDLAAMAGDPDIQIEIATINEEFAVAEMEEDKGNVWIKWVKAN